MSTIRIAEHRRSRNYTHCRDFCENKRPLTAVKSRQWARVPRTPRRDDVLAFSTTPLPEFRSKLYWLTMRCVAIGIDPSFLALAQRVRLGKIFLGDQLFKRGEPVLKVSRTIVGFTALSSSLELLCESRGPLSPSEMSLHREPYGNRKRLCLPRLGKHGGPIVAG